MPRVEAFNNLGIAYVQPLNPLPFPCFFSKVRGSCTKVILELNDTKEPKRIENGLGWRKFAWFKNKKLEILRGTFLKVKGTVTNQSSNDPREVVGASFAADAIKRFGQLIVLLNKCTNSFAASCIVADEKTDALRDALSQLVIGLHPLDCPKQYCLLTLHLDLSR